MYTKVTGYPAILVGLTAILFCATSILSGSAWATHSTGNQWRQSAWNDDHVIVFSECGFTGLTKSLPPGEFPAIRQVGVDHNAISSIIIPPGMAVEIFQLGKFGGHWYRLNQNQICLKGNWNDQIRSIRVLEDNPENSYGFSQKASQGSGGGHCHEYTVRSEYGVGAIRFADRENRLTEVRPRQPLQGEICQQDPLRVELAKQDRQAAVVLSIGGQEYRFEQWAQYDNYQSNWYRKYLTIDLPVRSQGRDREEYGQNGWGNTKGFGKRYSSGIQSGDNWGNNYPKNWYKKAARVQPEPDATPALNCTQYTVSANHPDTGIRFLVGDSPFRQVGNGTENGRICHSGRVRVELAKKRPPAEVILRIGSRVFAFRGGDQGTQLLNGWYRKYFTVDLH